MHLSDTLMSSQDKTGDACMHACHACMKHMYAWCIWRENSEGDSTVWSCMHEDQPASEIDKDQWDAVDSSSSLQPLLSVFIPDLSFKLFDLFTWTSLLPSFQPKNKKKDLINLILHPNVLVTFCHLFPYLSFIRQLPKSFSQIIPTLIYILSNFIN